MALFKTIMILQRFFYIVIEYIINNRPFYELQIFPCKYMVILIVFNTAYKESSINSIFVYEPKENILHEGKIQSTTSHKRSGQQNTYI